MLKHQENRDFCLFAQGCSCRLYQAHRIAQLGRTGETQGVTLKKRSKCKTRRSFCFISGSTNKNVSYCHFLTNSCSGSRLNFVPGKKREPQKMALPNKVDSDSVTMTHMEAFIKQQPVLRKAEDKVRELLK